MALTAKNDEHLGVTSAPLILFRDNANWNDVIPIFNNSMEDGAVKISVSAECKYYVLILINVLCDKITKLLISSVCFDINFILHIFRLQSLRQSCCPKSAA